MKSRIFLAGIALAVFTPVVASAQDDCCRSDGDGRTLLAQAQAVCLAT